MPSETALFLRQLIRNPRRVSAIAPSSPFLARAMARSLGPTTGRVVEFGPGTGSLTRGILARGVPPANLTCFELDPDFVTNLRAAFPGVTIHHAGADHATEFVKPGVDAVISGLPLLSMPHPVIKAIVGAAFAVLKPGAPYIQFTYGPKPPVPAEVMEELGLRVEMGPHVLLNLPPARVYLFRRA
jgi:phosphatidylethanolamine/phosphatidyl-N-methylethanolamine N-methyltransferase